MINNLSIRKMTFPHIRFAVLTLISISIGNAEENFNNLVLNGINQMPNGGGYATNLEAAIGLRRSNDVRGGNLFLVPKLAVPSYCSGATYLVFLKAVRELQQNKRIDLNEQSLRRLLVQGDSDGNGYWGRWNANGPGTAKLVADLKIGKNFEDIRSAKKGDFLKIFWSKEIGAQERGHSVIYLGKHQNPNGEWEIEYWSSNKPLGYGLKTTKAHFMKWCLFTRIDSIEGFKNVSNLSQTDEFLASMLLKGYTRNDIRRRCKIIGTKFSEHNLQIFLDPPPFAPLRSGPSATSKPSRQK